jgi:phosphoenolpyruvate-protein kinase (PTS system EI component)
MWRNPRCQPRELRDILVSLEHASDQFSVRLRAVENSDDFYAILAVNNELVARTLAWKTMQHWQKWSRQEETQYLREQRVKFEPKVSADGKTVKVRVKVSTLGD